MPETLARHGTKDLTNEQRHAVYEYLLEHSSNGKPKHGSIKTAAGLFSVCPKTIHTIWQQGRLSIRNGAIAADVSAHKAGHVGRKKKEINLDQLKKIPLRQRQNIRSLASALGASKTIIHSRIQEGLIKPHSNAMKPLLTDGNKRARLEFCISQLKINPPNKPIFHDMMNIVHIDEKWFYMTKTNQKYYLAIDEELPHRACKSKTFITKIMFLCAVARPRWDHGRNQWFNGKLGIFPFITREEAKRASKNRPAGTMETKPIISINREIIRKCLIEDVLPAIRSKWPQGHSGPILIQQDNAKPHVAPGDELFVAESQKDGFDIQLICQPPNSPDMNVLDLGFFQAIQSVQYQQAPQSIDDLVQAVQDSFQALERAKLNNVFLSLQQVLIEVMKVGGGNKYVQPHMQKNSLDRQGILPISLECEPDILECTINALEQQ